MKDCCSILDCRFEAVFHPIVLILALKPDINETRRSPDYNELNLSTFEYHLIQ